MKRTIFLALIFMCATLANAQILYRISGNGLKSPSYIIGTHHLVDESFVPQIPGINQVMKDTKQVYGEVIMSNLLHPDTVKLLQSAMMLPYNKSIKDFLDTEHMNMLNNLFVQIVGVPFDNPMISGPMGNMRPSALESQIAALMYMKERPGKFDATKGIDSYFQNQAVKNKKKVGGLETCNFQMDLLFNSQPVEQEILDLNCLLENQDISHKQLISLTDAYLDQNAEKIEYVMTMKYGNQCDEISSEGNQRLIEMRNNNWLEQMPAIMKTAPTLFVVGAGHLFGENGILTLLTNTGYTIEPVTE